MSLYLCTNIIMLKEIEKYVSICCAPHIRIPKKSTVIFDWYKSTLTSMYKTVWFRNMFIEYLIKEWIIKTPMMIYSPRKDKTTQTNSIICEWVYRNINWHIYYDPSIINDSDQIRAFNSWEFEIYIKLPDVIALAYVTWQLENIINWIKEPLTDTLVQWNFSENE